jgi:hypothetical protein
VEGLEFSRKSACHVVNAQMASSSRPSPPVEEREQAAQTILLRDRRAMKAVRDGLEQKQRK